MIETFQLITLVVCCSYFSNLIGRRTINIPETILGVHGLMGFTVKPRLHERFFACDGDAIFLIVALPARSENCMCSHSRTGDVTDEKITEKNCEKFNELNFLRQNHSLCQRVATHAIFAVCCQRDNFKKIASPSQEKNRLCSRGSRIYF